MVAAGASLAHDRLLALILAGFALWAQYGGAPPGATYVPAHMENRQLVRTFK
jgi:hypothetical protein